MNDETKKKVTWIETFERNIVFRVARGYFVLMAAVAVLAFGGGLITGFFGFVRVPVVKAPDPPPVPEPPPLSLAAVEKWQADQNAADQTKRNRPDVGERSRFAEQATEVNKVSSSELERQRRQQQRTQIETLINQLKTSFPDPPYVWEDLYKTTCVSFIQGYGCIKSERNLEKKGIVGVLSAKLENNKADDIIAKLGALQTVLSTAPVEKRGELIVVTLDAYDDIRRDYTQKVDERESIVARNEAEFRSDTAEQQASKSKFRQWGLYGVAAGLALIVLVSIFLAHLAIERQTRLLRGVLESLEKTAGRLVVQSPAVSSPVASPTGRLPA